MNESFAAALKQNRDKLNTKFAYAKHAYPSLDGDTVQDHLRLFIEPAVEKVAQIAPDKVEESVIALFDVSLDLIGKGLLGAETRYPAILKGWTQLFNQLPHLLAQNPLRFAGAVMNALFNLSVAQNTRPTFWIDEVLRVGRNCVDLAEFLEVGKIVAWRSGMSHFRDGALDACLQLESSLACAALCITDSEGADIREVVAKLRPDPWLAPWIAGVNRPAEKGLKIVSTVGAFRGFGGSFVSQPEVICSGEDFYVFDIENCWQMTADLFGATLHRIGATLPDLQAASRSEFKIDKAGNVLKGKHYASYPHLAPPSSSAANSATLAVTVPFSFAVYLIALV